jgi:CRP/FNR family cyclic AMP-dependent transcriptional regulator
MILQAEAPMGLKDETELLQAIPLFTHIDASKLKLLAFTSEMLTFAEGEALFERGNLGDFVYVIVHRTADVLIETSTGSLLLATLDEHDVVGEVAVLCNLPRTATVRASTELKTLRITKDFFSEIVFEFPQVAVEIMRRIALRLEKTTCRLSQAVAVG